MAKPKVVKGCACSRDSRVEKHPRITVRHDEDKPSWRFSCADAGGPFAWPRGDQKEIDILDKLRHFDSMKWSEIQSHQNHAIAIEHLSSEAKRRLQDINLDDIDELFSFRLCSATRVFCIRVQGVAKLLWYDPDHLVCPSKNYKA